MRGNQLTAEFIRIRSGLQDLNYLLATIDWHIAPVCYSVKPGVLINLGNSYSSCLAKLWNQYHETACIDTNSIGWTVRRRNSCPEDHEIFFNELTINVIMGINNSIQLLCYAPKRIEAILRDDEIRSFLKDRGYISLDTKACIQVLRERLCKGCPHEIGIFLGYPIADVKAFIQNKGRNYLLNGYWKVYSDVPGALDTFQSYNEARKKMLVKFSRGAVL